MRLARTEGTDIYQWHRWFAWYPVRTPDYWVWLETVARKRRCYDTMWEYL